MPDQPAQTSYGPLAAPYARRSEYLRQALEAMQEQGQHIRSAPELGVRLLALALNQYGQVRNERSLQNAMAKDFSGQPGQQFLASLDQGGPAEEGRAGPSVGTLAGALGGLASGGQSMTGADIGQFAGGGEPEPPPPPPPPSISDALYSAMVNRESGGRQNGRDGRPLTSGAGAFGVAQLMPGTAQQVATSLGDPSLAQTAQTDGDTNLRLGRAYFDQLTQQFGGNQIAAAAAYNAGPQVINDWVNGTNSQYRSHAAGGAMRPTNPNGLRLGLPQAGQEAQWADRLPWRETRRYVQGVLPSYTANQTAPSPSPPPASAGAPPVMQPSPPAAQTGGLPDITRQAPMQTPQPQQQPSNGFATAQGRSAVTQEEINVAIQMSRSPDPQVRAQGEARALALRDRINAPPNWDVHTNDATGQTILTNRTTGEQRVQSSGARTPGTLITQNGVQGVIDLNNPTAAPQQVPIMPSAMNRNGDASAFGLNAPPGTNITVGPYNTPSVINAPPAGTSYQGGRQTPLAGAPGDITSAQTRIPALMEAQNRLRPLLDQGRDLFQNINAVRVGIRSNSGEGDLAIANGLQHLMDAGIVREEDMRNQARALGIQGDVMQVLGYLRRGGRLNDPEVRARFGRLAESLYQPRIDMLRSQVMGQRDLLEQYGPGSFDLVVPPATRQEFGWEPRPQAQRPQSAPVRRPAGSYSARRLD